MQVDASKNQNFSFSYTTSSGKSLSLSMYDNQSASVSKDNEGASLSLRREYGFSFSFQGSKLTQSDVAEIKDAMKEVEPLISEFMQNSKVGELKPKDFIESAMNIANLLPASSDENKQNATLDSLVSRFDKLLNKQAEGLDTGAKANLLEDSKKLLEEVLKKMQEKLEEQRRELEEKTANAAKKDDSGLNLLA